MRYPTPPGDGLTPIVDEFSKTRREQREQARPSGTSIAQSLRQLRRQQQRISNLVLSASDRVAGPFESGPIPADGVTRYIATEDAVATIECPTGAMTVVAGVMEVIIRSKYGSVWGSVTFEVEDADTGAVVVERGPHRAGFQKYEPVQLAVATMIGVPASAEHVIVVPPGRYRVRVKLAYAALTAGNEVMFHTPYVICRVIS